MDYDYEQGIRIGENKWINWVNNNPSNNSEIIEIDELLISTYDFGLGWRLNV